MSHSNTSIYTETVGGVAHGVEIADIQSVLNLPNNDIGALIAQGVAQNKINKWAKYKPIHYPGKFLLEEGDYRGRVLDTTDSHLVYGLEVPAQASNIYPPSGFHNVTWNYKGYPNATGLSGTSLYRFLDFNKNDAEAVADLSGNIPSTARFYARLEPSRKDFGIQASEVYVGYNKSLSSQTPYNGVELAKYVVSGDAGAGSMTDAELFNKLCNCYPGILIGDATGTTGTYYLTALTNIDNANSKTIMYNNGTSASPNYVKSSSSWGVDFTKTDSDGNEVNFGSSYPCSTLATLVLIYIEGANPYLIHGDSDTDITQYWIDVSQDQPWGARIFPLPNASGESISIDTYHVDGYIVTPVSVAATSTQFVVTCDVTATGSTSAGASVEFQAHFSGGNTATTTVLIPRNSTATSLTATFTVAMFNGDPISFTPGSQSTVYLTVTATATGASSGNTTTATLPMVY